jgi:site-specific recombinase XerD
LFRNLNAEQVLSFLARLEMRRGNAASTRNARLAAVRSFVRYAFIMGCISRDRHERLCQIAFKRCSARVVTYLEPEELEAVFRAVDYRTHDGFRDLVMLKLLYNTGARASELAGLRVSDVDCAGLRVTITGKGRKRRLCGLWETAAALIRMYLASDRRVPCKGFEDRLFIDQRRRAFTRYGVWDIVHRYVRRAARSCPSLASKRVTPHAIRHTTGVHLYEAGVDMNTIREWLGHEHISTAEIYARPTLKMKRAALARLEHLDRRLFSEIATSRNAANVAPGIRRWIESLKD